MAKPWNVVNIDIVGLSEYFKTHTLKQCAEFYKCSRVSIKRKLKLAGIDTSIHNHSELAKNAHRETLKDTSCLTREFLYREYIIENKDTKTIAAETGLHHNTIRNRVRKFGLKKSPKNVLISMKIRYYKATGFFHPGQNPQNIRKTARSSHRILYKPLKGGQSEYVFRSLHELSYALFLDSDNDVQSWDYELINIPYIDSVTGKHRMYMIDFSIQSHTQDRWIEVKPAESMIPSDKRLYAAQSAQRAGIKFSGTTIDDRKRSFSLFKSGFRKEYIEFVRPRKLENNKTYTLWFKDKNEGEPQHDHYRYETTQGSYIKRKYKNK